MVATSASFYETPDTYPIDARGATDYWAFSTLKHLGAGQFYLMSTMDKHGRPLDGSRTYRLTGERAGHAILVGGSLRPGDPCPHPGRLFAEQVVANGGRQDQP